MKASLGALAAGRSEARPSQGTGPAQQYGTREPRVSFRSYWRDSRGHAFAHAEYPAFHRLQTSLHALYSRCEQPVTLSGDRPVRLKIKLLCEAEAGRTLFTLGLKSASHGCWAFSLGASPGRNETFGGSGWQILVNAADPWADRTSLVGFDNWDWHTFVLVVPGRAGPAELYCDGQRAMSLGREITSAQRERVSAGEYGRHGSIQQLVPETTENGDYVFIESRHPGQVLDLDSFELAQAPISTARTSLPVLRDLDWELDGVQVVESGVTRFDGNPVLKASEIPDPTGEGADHATVIRDEGGFRMYFNAACERRPEVGRARYAIYHAFSPNGVDWEVTPKTPVLGPGSAGAWDEGSLGQRGVLKEGGAFRMWYGGYVARLQQGRTGYAESRDGIHWTKPALGQFPFAGRPTNVVLSLQPGPYSNEYELAQSIVRADEAPSARRYVLFLHTQGPHGFIVDVATSPDGIRWRRAPHNARRHGFDESPRSSVLHPAAVAWHEPNYWWIFVGHRTATNATTRFTGWAVEPEETDNIGFGLWRSNRLHLEQEAQWERGPARVGSFIEVGDEWWVYYCSGGSVGLARVGRHRMLGLELVRGRDVGSIRSIAFRRPSRGWSGHHFAINAAGFAPGKRIEAELLDGSDGRVLPGFGLPESIAVDSDGYSTPLRWKTGYLPGAPDPSSLRVRLRISGGGDGPRLHALYLKL